MPLFGHMDRNRIALIGIDSAALGLLSLTQVRRPELAAGDNEIRRKNPNPNRSYLAKQFLSGSFSFFFLAPVFNISLIQIVILAFLLWLRGERE